MKVLLIYCLNIELRKVTENQSTVKPVLENTCIKRPPAVRDYCSDTTTLLKLTFSKTSPGFYVSAVQVF